MKKEKTNENAKTIGDVTHTHTPHTCIIYKMRK